MSPLDRRVLAFLQQIDLIKDVPDEHPGKRKVLARSPCFLHGGDNRAALMVFVDGFACDTGKCHTNKTFGCNLPGLVRHMVYRVTGRVLGWDDAWRYAKANPSKLSNLIGDTVRHAKNVSGGETDPEWSVADLEACLEFPDPYFLGRGYRPETLARFGVGRCVRTLPDGASLLGWSVIPLIFGYPRRPYGYLARDPRWKEGDRSRKYHVSGRTGPMPYNYPWAVEENAGPLVITEGVPDLMRFYEAGVKTVVAVLGDNIIEGHEVYISLLMHTRDNRLRKRIYVAADNDTGGENLIEKAKYHLGGYGELVLLRPKRTKDFGDATVEEIQSLGLPEAEAQDVVPPGLPTWRREIPPDWAESPF